MESHILYLFLKRIKDPDFDMKVEIQKNKYDNKFIQYVIVIRKQERDFMKIGSTDTKSRNKMRRVFKEDE